jgi:hypothetical protein
MKNIINYIKNNIVYINTIISFSSLMFQVSVLKQWHNKFDKKINNIQKILDKK